MIDEWIATAVRYWRCPSWWNLLIVLPWILGVVFCLHEWRVDRAIAMRQQIAHGTLTSHEPYNHDRYGYAFMLNGRQCTGSESPKGNELQIGKLVTVYYDPADPSKNALSDFDGLSAQSLRPVPLLMSGIGGLALFILLMRRRNCGKT
jgi:hypothetical protein